MKTTEVNTDELFSALSIKSNLMNDFSKKKKENDVSNSITKTLQTEIHAKNLNVVLSKMNIYFHDIWDSKAWDCKFAHMNLKDLFMYDDGGILYPTDQGKAMFKKICEGHMYIDGTTKVSGIFIMRSITDSKIALALKLFVIGMFPNVRIVSTNNDGTMSENSDIDTVPFQMLLINIVYICMYGRKQFDSFSDDNYYLPSSLDATMINQFLVATGLHKA